MRGSQGGLQICGSEVRISEARQGSRRHPYDPVQCMLVGYSPRVCRRREADGQQLVLSRDLWSSSEPTYPVRQGESRMG